MFRTEALAYWFFRLNGCMTIVNFLVHHERGSRDGTEVDILAVRFPFRQELALSCRAMVDHSLFGSDSCIEIVIAEVKKGRCALNGPWTDPKKQNMHRILYAIGAIPAAQVPAVAQALYKEGSYSDDQYRIRLFAIGEREDRNLASQVAQLTWQEISVFVFDRLRSYAWEKAEHDRWDDAGKDLYEEAQRHESKEAFAHCVLRHLKES